MRWAGRIARMGDTKKVRTVFWWGGGLRERDHLEDLGVDGSMIFKWIFKKWDAGHGLECSGSGLGLLSEACEGGNEPSGSIKCGEFRD